MNISSVIIIIFLVKVKPLSTKFLNFIEIFNELVLYGCTGLIAGMTDYQIDKQEGMSDEEFTGMQNDKQNKVGWAYIILSCLTIGMTLLTIIFNLLVVLRNKIIECQKKKKSENEQKEKGKRRKKKYDIEQSNDVTRI